MGKKRHILVDTQGLLMHALVRIAVSAVPSSSRLLTQQRAPARNARSQPRASSSIDIRTTGRSAPRLNESQGGF